MVKRSTLNLGFSGVGEYDFINHVLNGAQWGPVGNAYAATTQAWNYDLDANGWPQNSVYDNNTFGLGIRIPASSDFAGPYLLAWDGSGEVRIDQGTWSIDAGQSSNYTAVSSSRWHGSNSRIVLNYTGSIALFGLHVMRTNRDGSGNFLKNLRFMRLEDEEDYNSGKVFRTGWKQLLADLNPGAIRFMNWIGCNNSKKVRFEHRLKPTAASYGSQANWQCSPAYAPSTGTNQIAVASVTGTPASMQHGEVVCCRIGNSTVRNGLIYPINITKANPAVVSYEGTGFTPTNGDVLVFQIDAGMTEMNYRPVVVANVNAGTKTFECSGLDTSSGFTTFARDASQTGDTTAGSRVVTNLASTAGIAVGMYCFAAGLNIGARVESKTSTTVTFQDSATGKATATATGVALTFGTGTGKQYITLAAGTGNDRSPVGASGAVGYPVIFPDGTTPASNYGDGYIAAGDYKTFIFDKELVVSTEVTGAWVFNDSGAANGPEGHPPLEVCTALINELMEMTRSDGMPVDPIAMWITIPHRGILSMDPDYSAGSNWAVGAVDVIYNGANGYARLDSRCDLIVENTNETWNSGGTAFSQTYFYARKGFLRYGGSTTDYSSYSTLRAVVMVNDIKAAFPRASYPRIKYVICGQGTLGISGTNSVRISGNANYDGDVLNVWGGDPIDHFDAFAWAAYFFASSAFETANLATYVADWLAAATLPEKEAVCALYVAGIVGSGSGETTSRYGGTLLPAYASAMTAKSKKTWMYEGGWDRAISGSSDTQNFLTACKQSRAWAKALKDFFNMFDPVTDAEYPADYIALDARWGHASPDFYSGGIEGGALDLAWELTALRNRSKRQLVIKT